MSKLCVGPILGNQENSYIYCLDSDESSMIINEDQLDKQAKLNDEAYVRDNSAFILSVLGITKPSDHLILDEKFQEDLQLLNWQQSIFKKLSLEVTQNIHFVPAKDFAVFARKFVDKNNIQHISTICYSHLLQKSFPVDRMLDISKKVNAKTSLLALSEAYKFSIPKSLVLNFSDVSADRLQLLNFPGNPIYFKMDGLGGGYNVKKVTTKKDLLQFITKNRKKDGEVLIQQGMSDAFLESIHSFLIYPTHVKHVNSRIKLTIDHVWYGNIFFPDFSKIMEKQQTFFNAANALRLEGYANKNGLLAGFDGFTDLNASHITEINARWLGSTPVEQLLMRLNLLDKEVVLSSFDYIAEKDFAKYMQFSEKYLYDNEKDADFYFIPLSFSAYSADSKKVVYYVVIGDIESFSKAVSAMFGESSFVMVSNTMGTFRNAKNLLGGYYDKMYSK